MRSNQPALPWWARIPFLVGALAAIALTISAFVPWFTGDYDHVRHGPPISIGLIVASTVLASVLMHRGSGWSWAPGVLVLAAAVMILIGVEEQVVCPTDVEVEGNIAQACFTEEMTAGSTIFAVGAFASALASFVSPRLTRFGDKYSWARRHSS